MFPVARASLNGGAVLAASALVLGGASISSAQPPLRAAVDPAFVPYAGVTDSARLPDGRMIHVVCMGQGSPTVVLTAGSGDWSIAWYRVQPKVAEKTRVCAWDRAGFGMSSPAIPAQSVDQRTSDLQAALKADGIKGPYVAVGHSLGGYESLLLKDREPAAVVGMVLVDPSIPDQVATQRRVTPLGYAEALAHPPPFLPHMQKCAADLRAGTVWLGKPDPNNCMPSAPPTFPPELSAALEKAQLGPGPANYAGLYETMVAYQGWDFRTRDSTLVIKSDRNYGNMPLIVLTAGAIEPPHPDFSDARNAEIPKQFAEWMRAHDALAALSTRGVNRTVPDSTHYIHQLKPQVVIDAIDEVVDAARASKR